MTARLLLHSLIFWPVVLPAQNIIIHFTDGSALNYAIGEVRSTDFNGANMRVFLWDGTTYTWSMSSLDNYQFNFAPAAVPEIATVLAPLNLYPNPTSGELTIGFDVLGKSEVSVEVLEWAAINPAIQTLFRELDIDPSEAVITT